MTNSEIAYKESIQRPQYVADRWREVLLLLEFAFRSISNLYCLHDKLLQSNTKILEKITAVTKNGHGQEILKHLKRYIRDLIH